MFYVYFWLREDGSPYYVGKGKGDRGFQNDGHNVRRPPKHRILVQNFESEKDAFCAEKFFIAYYGRMDINTGCLRNRTDGGDGVSGLPRTEEHRRNLSISCKGKVISPEEIAERSKRAKGKPWTEARRRADILRIKRRPACHPERKHKSNGLCKPCAYRKWALENRIGKNRG